MKIEVVTKEEILELKAMMQEILDLLKEKNGADYDWTDANGIKEMLNCSDGALSIYRNSGILPFAKHGGKILYSRKVVNDILRKNMSQSAN
jgi:anthranilate phosphoribosyltransferase